MVKRKPAYFGKSVMRRQLTRLRPENPKFLFTLPARPLVCVKNGYAKGRTRKRNKEPRVHRLRDFVVFGKEEE
jgi:hypothetical protein